MSIQKPPLDPLNSSPNSNEIVTRIESERAIFHGNRELIRFAFREEKVKKVIGQHERVWES